MSAASRFLTGALAALLMAIAVFMATAPDAPRRSPPEARETTIVADSGDAIRRVTIRGFLSMDAPENWSDVPVPVLRGNVGIGVGALSESDDRFLLSVSDSPDPLGMTGLISVVHLGSNQPDPVAALDRLATRLQPDPDAAEQIRPVEATRTASIQGAVTAYRRRLPGRISMRMAEITYRVLNIGKHAHLVTSVVVSGSDASAPVARAVESIGPG
ncbi:MAG: hypothetical protein AAF334_10345 [Pseudomonadota bacterium]